MAPTAWRADRPPVQLCRHVAPFKIKCAKHMFPKGSIHYLNYDEDVFTCIQTSPNRTLLTYKKYY